MNLIPSSIQEKLSYLFTNSSSVTEINGGLFNYVYKIAHDKNISYLKIFTDTAKSSNFAPLPTSPYQRCFVVVVCHETAYKASLSDAVINVPEILNYDLDNNFILMSEANGTPLFDYLVDLKYPLKLIIANYEACMKWLFEMHNNVCASLEEIDIASFAFKKYKIDLQYFKLIKLLAPHLQQAANDFANEYLNSKKQLLHGDLNSRNILITNQKNVVSIIDFEQGQLGNGLYDVAYLCSELVIRLLASKENDLEHYISSLLKIYSHNLSNEEIIKCRIHLAFQVLYRLVGPSKNTWYGHLSESVIAEMRSWSMNQFEKLLL